jgi:hypothetical protein
MWGKCDRCVELTNIPPIPAVVMKSVKLNLLEPFGPLQACNGTALQEPSGPFHACNGTALLEPFGPLQACNGTALL